MFFSSFKIFSDLFTNRLILREPRLSDTVDIYELCSTDNATRYVDWRPHQSKKESAAFIRYLKRQIALGEKNSYTWFVEEIASGKVIATVSLVESDSSGKIATVGYSLNVRFQHKGYATEAVKRVIKYLFNEKGFERIEAKVLPDNIPSVNLLNRVGMKKEAYLRKGVSVKGKLEDVLIFSILRDEYL